MGGSYDTLTMLPTLPTFQYATWADGCARVPIAAVKMLMAELDLFVSQAPHAVHAHCATFYRIIYLVLLHLPN